MRITLLGSGNAGGVPLFGCDCPACERAKVSPAHRRQSACLLIETDQRRILIDAGLRDLPERPFTMQLDAVVLTHFHMDHVQGLFPLRWGRNIRLSVFGPDDPAGCDDLLKHPGILNFEHKAYPFEPFDIGNVTFTPLPLTHSKPTLGYIIEHGDKRIAYLTDTVGLPPETAAWLASRQLDSVILDCSFPPREQAPRNHNDLTRALDTLAGLHTERCLLTHIGHDFDTWLMENASHLPAHVGIAGDGQVIEC